MFDLKVRASSARSCPLCMSELEGSDGFTCEGCQVVYHMACARELGGCGTLGCSHGGIGPDGPASVASIRRHLARVGGQPTSAMDDRAVNQRAEVIREALLQQRAKLLEERRVRVRYETQQRRLGQLKLALTLLMWIVLMGFFLASLWRMLFE